MKIEEISKECKRWVEFYVPKVWKIDINDQKYKEDIDDAIIQSTLECWNYQNQHKEKWSEHPEWVIKFLVKRIIFPPKLPDDKNYKIFNI